MNTDPLSDIISLLEPEISQAKFAEASGAFRVIRDDIQGLYYCMLLEGKARIEISGFEPIEIYSGDFLLLLEPIPFIYSSAEPIAPVDLQSHPVQGSDGVFRMGEIDKPVNLKQLMGYCYFTNPDKKLLLSFLPKVILIRANERLALFSSLLKEETSISRPASTAVVKHLLHILLIEALRSTTDTNNASGLLKGLEDAHIRKALQLIHKDPSYPWTAEKLAKEAGMSRSSFFTKFGELLGVTPLVYVLNWRMTLAKKMLTQDKHKISEIAYKLGYGSPSAFSSAFKKNVGESPIHYREKFIDR